MKNKCLVSEHLTDIPYQNICTLQNHAVKNMTTDCIAMSSLVD